MWDWVFSLPWEAIRNWLGTLGGLLALGVATNTYRRNVKFKREEQARLVYSRITDTTYLAPGTHFQFLPPGVSQGMPWGLATREAGGMVAHENLVLVTAVVHNGSKELIGPGKIQVANGSTKKAWDYCCMLGSVEPESDYLVAFLWPNEAHPGQFPLTTTLIFRDASSQWWRRYASEPIERVHDDPENPRRTKAEREDSAAIARAMGLQPAPEPTVSLKVRFHRLVRRLRGKSPIP